MCSFRLCCVREYDYESDLKETENRVDWLKTVHLEAQQHGCCRLAEKIKEDMDVAEQDL